MSDGSAPRWWRRRRDLALAAAREAQGRAAVALLQLDTAQRSAFSHLDFLAGADAGPVGRRLRLAWSPVSAAADAAVGAYLGALERQDVTSDLEIETATAAAAAFTAHQGAMQTALAQIEAFSERFTSDFVHVTSNLEQLAGDRRAAEQALAVARTALADAAGAGLLTHGADALLTAAERHLQAAVAGPGGAGLAVSRQHCADAVAAAHQVEHEVAQLPILRDQTRTRAGALQTRLAGLRWRAGQDAGATWHDLRREFVASGWADLEAGPERFAAALAAAERHLALADVAAAPTAQRWPDALAALAGARDALHRAAAELDAPAARLALLRGLAADPQAAYAKARFAVRDARMLLMAGPVDPRHGQVLDRLSARLDSARQPLDRPHPDWLAYAHALDAIVDDAHGLVVDVRASRAP